MTRCRDCHRPLTRVSPDGYGPVCRRRRRLGDPLGGAHGLRPVPGGGQLALPVAETLPSPSAADLAWLYRADPEPRHPTVPQRLRGRRVDTIPALPAYL
ncbi:hypothetical protein QNO07_09520 [Streptomyces sp. 549]|uniref:hypothetical protein n=1 Tax=Streptomyces sp. 549 TaxID=3049076 RepID=UPI0024C37F41|nr:hypothetical protein [Streptomyces sp. 549]MDK1473658.1 hypothetical protein [Streptomyces sp. 549]